MTIPAAPIGYLAASLVYATFCAKRMVPLRTLAIASNLAFIAYGYLDALWPILILHGTLLPLNVLRLIQANDGPASRPADRRNASIRHASQICRRLANAGVRTIGFTSSPVNSSESRRHVNKHLVPSTTASTLGAARQQGTTMWLPFLEHRLDAVCGQRHALHDHLSCRVPTPAIAEGCPPLLRQNSAGMPIADNAIAATFRRRNLIARTSHDAAGPSGDD